MPKSGDSIIEERKIKPGPSPTREDGKTREYGVDQNRPERMMNCTRTRISSCQMRVLDCGGELGGQTGKVHQGNKNRMVLVPSFMGVRCGQCGQPAGSR